MYFYTFKECLLEKRAQPLINFAMQNRFHECEISYTGEPTTGRGRDQPSRGRTGTCASTEEKRQ